MDKPNRYIIFCANYLPHLGGVERYTHSLSKELDRMGYRVTIVTNNVYELADRERLTKRVDIIRLPCFAPLKGRMPIPRYNRRFRNLLNELDACSCRGILINTRFYIHTILALRLAKAANVVPIVLDHGSAYLTFGNKTLDILVKAYEHVVTSIDKRYPARYYAVSRRSGQWLKTFGIESKGVLSNAIDAAEYRSQASNRDYRKELEIPTGNLLVAFIGRLVPEKGISLLLEAFRLLGDAPISLIVAGDGPMRQLVESNRGKNIHYVGRLDSPDIAALLLQSDIFCLPTRSEGFSTSLLEASACGTPSIITNVGGADELIPNDSYGIVLDGPTAESLKDSLMMAFKQRNELPKKGSQSQARVEECFTWVSTAENFISACEKANSQ